MEWPMRNLERRAVRLQEMMRKLNSDTALLKQIAKDERYFEARQKCLNCLSADECLPWLASQSVGEPEFCPNREMFTSRRKSI